MLSQVETKMFLSVFDLHDLCFDTRHTLLIFRDAAVRADNTDIRGEGVLHIDIWAYELDSFTRIIILSQRL